METRANDCAWPCSEEGTSSVGTPIQILYPGMTKREYFALHFAASYASADYVANSGKPYGEMAEFGVEMADALISELNKQKL